MYAIRSYYEAMELWNALKEKAKTNEDLECNLGVMAAFLGYKDEAFYYLNIAVDKRTYPIVYFLTGSFAENLKNDPRYPKLLEKTNLPVPKTIMTANQ